MGAPALGLKPRADCGIFDPARHPQCSLPFGHDMLTDGAPPHARGRLMHEVVALCKSSALRTRAVLRHERATWKRTNAFAGAIESGNVIPNTTASFFRKHHSNGHKDIGFGSDRAEWRACSISENTSSSARPARKVHPVENVSPGPSCDDAGRQTLFRPILSAASGALASRSGAMRRPFPRLPPTPVIERSFSMRSMGLPSALFTVRFIGLQEPRHWLALRQ